MSERARMRALAHARMRARAHTHTQAACSGCLATSSQQPELWA